MNRSALNKIIQEELANLTTEAVPSNIQSFANRQGAHAKRLVRQVDGWAKKIGKRIVGGTAVGKDYSTLILDLTHQGGEIAIDLDEETIEVQGEPVESFKEFEMAVMNLTNEAIVKEAQKNNHIITIKQLSDVNHTRLVKWMHNEFAGKPNSELKRISGSSTKGDFTLDTSNWDKKDIAVLKKYLKSQDYMFEGIVKEAKQEAVYMAPKGRASLQPYNGKICTVVSDEGKTVTIQFKGGKTITEVPKEQLRFVKGTVKEAVEYVDKDSPESKIVVRGFGNYITLMQTDFDDKKTTTFVVGTEQIAKLIKVLNKFKKGPVTEADNNDPVLMAMRAAKMEREKSLSAQTASMKNRVFGKQRAGLEDDLNDIAAKLKGLYSDKRNTLNDMEAEAGQMGNNWSDADANRYGSELNKIDSAIASLIKRRQSIEVKLAY